MIDPKEIKEAYEEYTNDLTRKDQYIKEYTDQMKSKMNYFYNQCIANYRNMRAVVLKTEDVVKEFEMKGFIDILHQKKGKINE